MPGAREDFAAAVADAVVVKATRMLGSQQPAPSEFAGPMQWLAAVTLEELRRGEACE